MVDIYITALDSFLKEKTSLDGLESYIKWHKENVNIYKTYETRLIWDIIWLVKDNVNKNLFDLFGKNYIDENVKALFKHCLIKQGYKTTK